MSDLPAEQERRANAVAIEAMRAAGYTIVETEVKSRRSGIDIVARDSDGFVFAEVYTAQASANDRPPAISREKTAKVFRAVRQWLTQRGLWEAPWRLILVGVDLNLAGRPIGTRIAEEPFPHLKEFRHGDS